MPLVLPATYDPGPQGHYSPLEEGDGWVFRPISRGRCGSKYFEPISGSFEIFEERARAGVIMTRDA